MSVIRLGHSKYILQHTHTYTNTKHRHTHLQKHVTLCVLQSRHDTTKWASAHGGHTHARKPQTTKTNLCMYTHSVKDTFQAWSKRRTTRCARPLWQASAMAKRCQGFVLAVVVVGDYLHRLAKTFALGLLPHLALSFSRPIGGALCAICSGSPPPTYLPTLSARRVGLTICVPVCSHSEMGGGGKGEDLKWGWLRDDFFRVG